MKKVFQIICLISLVSMAMTACKDKNAKPAEDPEITSLPFHNTSPTDPRAVASKLENATSAVADKKDLVWAGDVDAVCGMKITQSVTDTVHYQGKIYGFCSESCKGSFQKDPQKWASKGAN